MSEGKARRFRPSKAVPSASAGAFIGKRGALEDRFWRCVEKGTPDACWVWRGSQNTYGYGTLGLGGVGRASTAHRVSWELHRGPIPPGAVICHRCDNPPCVNPDHLFVGSPRDNVMDAISKGRMRPPDGARGERHRSAKLTEAAVCQIRELAPTRRPREIAAMFGVRREVIYDVLRGRTWKRVASAPQRQSPTKGSDAGCDGAERVDDWAIRPGTFEVRASCPRHPWQPMRRCGEIARCSECGDALAMCDSIMGWKHCVREKGHIGLHVSPSGSAWPSRIHPSQTAAEASIAPVPPADESPAKSASASSSSTAAGTLEGERCERCGKEPFSMAHCGADHMKPPDPSPSPREPARETNPSNEEK